MPAPSGGGEASPATSPAVRFLAAVARRPLGRGRPIPSRLRRLTSASTGGARVSITTGSATRAALDAAGARAATTGTTVHLPAPPGDSARELGVMAHELTHATEGRRAPRFLLAAAHDRARDAAEQRAEAVGRAVETAAGSARSRASDAAGAASSLAARALGSAGRAGRDVFDAPASRVPGAFGPASSGRPLGSRGLPVAGPAAAAGAAAAASAGAARDALSSGLGRARGSADERVEAALGERLAHARGTMMRGAPEAAGRGAEVVGPAAGTGSASAGVTGAAADNAAAAPTAPSGGSGAGIPWQQVDVLLEELEQRVLSELERRGGRYAGVF